MLKSVRIMGLIVAAVVFCGISPALAATETFQESYEVKADTTLTVLNKNGSIKVFQWDKEFVDVVAEKKTLMGGNLKDVKIEVSIDGEAMKIETIYLIKNPRVSVNYTITIPSFMLVEHLESSNGAIDLQGTQGDAYLHTSNGAIEVESHVGKISAETSNGAIKLNDVKGVVEAETSNGAIRLTQIAGITRAKSSNGVIRADIRELLQDTEIRTSNGAIKLYLSPDIHANIEMKTSNGKIGLHSIEVLTSEVSKTELIGRIGEGGKKLAVKTSNGSIDLYSLE